MFQRKRQLKKDQGKVRKKFYFKILVLVLGVLAVFEVLYFNFYFGKFVIVSPLSKNTSSNILMVENQFGKKNISYSKVTEEPDGSVSVILKEGGEVIIAPKKNLNTQLSSLQLMLSRLTIDGKRLKTLDFRYDNPVVSF